MLTKKHIIVPAMPIPEIEEKVWKFDFMKKEGRLYIYSDELLTWCSSDMENYFLIFNVQLGAGT